ncbi:MAG: flagellar hook-length control protein FliK [Deltaproteobacteria bacterium]|nr:flagellar hook-length control protein FliK [Deltaproteobacteria bacterium]
MAITADIQQQVYDLLSRTSNLSFVNADQEPGTRISLTPGQRVTAEVLTTLPNNRAQVQVGPQRFNLDLPMAVRQGQLLEMTFISEDPRSTFAIARQGGVTPPVSLSDASRLLGLLVGSEQIADPKLRSSLQSIGDMLRRSAGEAGVLANLMDEALTYGGILREGVKAPPRASGDFMQQSQGQGTALQRGGEGQTPGQAALSAFEANASQILRNLARSSRFILAEAVNQPVVPLPLMPGEEVDAAVLGTLPGGRAFVQLAGASLELLLPRAIQAGDILRLTYISSQPKPLFALPRGGEALPSSLSEAGRWLSVLEHHEGGLSEQQMYVLERLNSVLKSLPTDSPAFTAIQDEAITYQTIMRGRHSAEQTAQAGIATVMAQQATLQPGNGIVLNDDMAKLLQALIKGNRLALLEALNQQAMPMGLAPGQQLKGEVIALLGGGRFLLQVAGQSLEFSMPKGTQRGDLINLFFITDEPTPTFLMARFGRPGDSRVSETGRWLSGFLGATSEQLPAQATLGILRTLLAEPPAEATQVGKMLQQGLRESGLFYESHLARWFGGDYTLQDILREPQGRLSSLRLPLVPQQAGAAADEAARAGMKNGTLEAMETMLRRAGTAQAHEGIADQRTLALVREQLDTLQSGQIVFRGELFPGQRMEWAVAEREARRNATGEEGRNWDTRLSLDLPKLGPVNARLILENGRISIDLRAGNAASAVLLDAARPALIEQLQAAGLSPAEIGIRHDAPGE